MSLTFYFAPMSTASMTDLVLAELGIPCERVALELSKGATKTPEFLAINPNGKVPVIVHDGTVIWESSAITMYLGEVFGVERGLYPPAGPARGEVMKWVAWTNVSLGSAVQRYAHNTAPWVPAEQQNAKAGALAKDEVIDHLRILDAALAKRAYLGGDKYTVADTHLHSLIDWVRHLKIDVAAHPNVEAWSQRCAARPAYQASMAAQAAAMASNGA